MLFWYGLADAICFVVDRIGGIWLDVAVKEGCGQVLHVKGWFVVVSYGRWGQSRFGQVG